MNPLPFRILLILAMIGALLLYVTGCSPNLPPAQVERGEKLDLDGATLQRITLEGHQYWLVRCPTARAYDVITLCPVTQ